MLQYIEWQRNQDSLLGEHVLQRQANDSVRRRQDKEHTKLTMIINDVGRDTSNLQLLVL